MHSIVVTDDGEVVYYLAPEMLKMVSGSSEMKHQAASIMFTIFAVVAPAMTATPLPGRDEQKAQPKKEQKGKAASLTGCVDEQDGRYVLVDDRALQPIADLEADGFPTEGFAKHMGHKVTVRGTSIPGGTRPMIKVRSIKTVSETCAPQELKQGRF